ncbi:MAG: hypothetical protein MUF59_09315, partial [Candidatus Krumholzibacteria bacterium]|nr:hypothetical protein [Candidatus Krumholzibacteria bacterium]
GTFSVVCGAEDAGGIVLRYAPKEGQVLKYKGSITNEAFFQGNEFMNVHSDIVEISLIKMTEDGKYDVKLHYLESVDKRGMAGSALEDFEGSIKPAGRSIDVTVDTLGNVLATNGLLPGLKRGKPTTEYAEKWFFELPAGTLAQGSTWTREFPEKNAGTAEGDSAAADEDAPDEEATGLIGTVTFELKKVEKKDGIEIAQIQFKGDLKMHTQDERGTLNGEVKLEGKVKVAIDGGYVVESESSFEMKGKVVSKDEFSGKETEQDVQQLRYTEVKLEK